MFGLDITTVKGERWGKRGGYRWRKVWGWKTAECQRNGCWRIVPKSTYYMIELFCETKWNAVGERWQIHRVLVQICSVLVIWVVNIKISKREPRQYISKQIRSRFFTYIFVIVHVCHSRFETEYYLGKYKNSKKIYKLGIYIPEIGMYILYD